MPRVFKRKYRSLNEEFADQYKGNYLVSDNTTGLDPHVNADYVKAANDFEKSKKVMKDDFKELDKAVDQFIRVYELEEVPKKIKSTPQLKAMKLSEGYIDTTGTIVAPGETVTEEQLEEYFDMNKDEDPILADYVSFEGWLDDSVKSGQLIKEGLTESVMLDVNELPEISLDMIEEISIDDDSDDDDKEELKECSDDKDAWDDLYEQLKNN